MSTRPVALVTGANKGIGLQVAKDLFAKGFSVVLACRDVGLGRAAMTEIAKPYEDEIMGENHKLSVIKLDLNDAATIPTAVEEFKRYQDRLDVLVNNIGIYSKDPKETLLINYTRTVDVTEAFLSLVAAAKAEKTNKSRIVFVSSRMGQLTTAKVTGDAQKVLTAAPSDITVAKLNELAAAYVDGKGAEVGLGGDAYGTSKALLSGYARSLAARVQKEGLALNVNYTCPGYTKTDLTGNQGMKTVEQGAETISWVCSDSEFDNVTGKFFGDHKEMSYE